MPVFPLLRFRVARGGQRSCICNSSIEKSATCIQAMTKGRKVWLFSPQHWPEPLLRVAFGHGGWNVVALISFPHHGIIPFQVGLWSGLRSYLRICLVYREGRIELLGSSASPSSSSMHIQVDNPHYWWIIIICTPSRVPFSLWMWLELDSRGGPEKALKMSIPVFLHMASLGLRSRLVTFGGGGGWSALHRIMWSLWPSP